MNTTIALNFIRSAKAPQIKRRRDDEEHALEEHVGHHGNGQAGAQCELRGPAIGPDGVDALA